MLIIMSVIIKLYFVLDIDMIDNVLITMDGISSISTFVAVILYQKIY